MVAESADHPAEEMFERHDHSKNLNGTIRIQLFARSFILRVYDVLARHRGAFSRGSLKHAIWWRRARFSSCRAVREWKIADRVAKSVVRERSIGGGL
jgi:hypothetical protein